MSTILDRIVTQTKLDLKVRRASVSLDDLRERAEPSTRSFIAALKTPGLSLIAEYKPKSPSMGDIRPDASPEMVARLYGPRAHAMSVLCDTPFFGGGYDLLSRVRAACDLPLLAKDFVVDTYQIYEARVHGADAILLMASILDPDRLWTLLALTRSLGMAALVETHDEAELAVALEVGAMVIGVNSRDLRTLEINLDQAIDRLQRVPKGHLRIAESGLRSRSDVDHIRPHADAALIGTHFMTAEDPATAMADLGWDVRC